MLTDLHLLRFIAKPDLRIEIYRSWWVNRNMPIIASNHAFPDFADAALSGFFYILSFHEGFDESILPRLNVLAEELKLLLVAELLEE